MEYTTIQIGRHSELIAMTGLISHHFIVAEPITTEAFDLVILDPSDNEWKKAQVKKAHFREERNAIVVYAKKNNGDVYTKKEVDVFITVHNGEIYLFPNREITEYWATPRNIDKKWSKLETQLQ